MFKTGIPNLSFTMYPFSIPTDEHVLLHIGVRGGGAGGAADPPGLKNFRANSVFRAIYISVQ